MTSAPAADLVAILEEAARGSAGISFAGEGAVERMSYAELLHAAREWASLFRANGIGRGDRVVVALPTSADFAQLFFGLVLAGAVPSAQPVPHAFGDIPEYVATLRRTLAYLDARALVVPAAFAEAAAGSGVPVLTPSTRGEPGGGALHAVAPDPAEAAYLQCTSGSTGDPKGVVLTHASLVANVRQIGVAVGVTTEDRVVCWLPLYHDMGLIGCLLFAAAWGLEARFLPPSAFLRRPAAWLRAVSEARGSLSPAPNFAFRYAATRIRDEELTGVDLSSWRVACCGGEPVEARTIEAFQSRFAPWGLRSRVVAPCYGLAEATLAVTFHAPGEPLAVERVDRRALAERGVAVPASPGDATAVELASSGSALPPTRVRIVGSGDGEELPAGSVGAVQVVGPGVMREYWRLPAATAAALDGGWLDTGDRGFLREGRLFITGREKDAIIIRGLNHDPSDFEAAAGEVPGVRAGAVVAIGVADEATGTEQLVLLCETDLEEPSARDELRRAVRARVALRTDVLPGRIELLGRNQLPKTTSGKVQRSRARAILASGSG